MIDRDEMLCFGIENFFAEQPKKRVFEKTGKLVLGPLRADIVDRYSGNRGAFVGRLTLAGRRQSPFAYYAAIGDPKSSVVYWIPRRMAGQPEPNVEFVKAEDMTRYDAYASLAHRMYGVGSPKQSTSEASAYFREIKNLMESVIGITNYNPTLRVVGG